MQSRTRFAVLLLLVLALIGLIVVLTLRRSMENSAPPPIVLTDDQRVDAERIIRSRINSLSPTPPKLGGRFTVEKIEWNGRGVASVTYGDGESTLEGTLHVQTGSGRVKIDAFTIKE